VNWIKAVDLRGDECTDRLGEDRKENIVKEGEEKVVLAGLLAAT